MRVWVWMVYLIASVFAGAQAATPAFSPVALSTPLLGGQPGVALEPGRGFVVTWQEPVGDRSSLRWMTVDFAGRETGAGLVTGGANRFVNWADTPSLVVLENGDWVSFWLERNDPETPEGYDIFVVRSTDRGRTWSSPRSPHRDGTKTQHGFVSMIADGEDRVMLVWLDGHHDHEIAPMTLRAAVLDRGDDVRDEVLLDERVCSCCQTDLARWDDQLLVVYRDRSEDEIRDISLIQRSEGRWLASARVNDDGWQIEGCPVNGPAVASHRGKALIFWPTIANEKIVLRLALFDSAPDASPAKIVRDLDVASDAAGRVDAVAWRDGFLLTWVSRDREQPSVQAAYLALDGTVTPIAPIARPATRGRMTGFPRIASDGTSGLVVWPESEQGVPMVGIAYFR